MNPISIQLMSLVSLVMVIILVFWLYRDYRIDSFRQKMFGLRDELFDRAVGEKIGFHDRSYGVLRSTINGFIRFAPRINLLQMILLLYVAREELEQSGESFIERLQESAKDCPPEQQEIIERLCVQMNYLVLEHLALSSPLLFTVVIPLGFVIAAKNRAAAIVARFSRPLHTLDNIACKYAR